MRIILMGQAPFAAKTVSLYFNYLFSMGIDAIIESVDLIKAGKAPGIPQDENLATYEPTCDDGVAQIDWSKPGTEIYNLVRGCDPQPGAYCFWNDQKIKFYGCKYLASPVDASLGEVTEVTDGSIKISTGAGILEVSRVRTSDLGKVKVKDFVEKSGIRKSDKFQYKEGT